MMSAKDFNPDDEMDGEEGEGGGGGRNSFLNYAAALQDGSSKHTSLSPQLRKTLGTKAAELSKFYKIMQKADDNMQKDSSLNTVSSLAMSPEVREIE